MEFVTIGDLHLDKARLWDILGAKTLDLQMQAVRYVLDYARSNKVDEVVFLGDISDLPRLSDLSAKAFYELLLSYPDLTFHIILGNHDIEQKVVHSLTTLDVFAKAGLLENICLYTEPTARGSIEFLPYPHSKPQSKTSLCFGHIERPGATRDNGSKMKDTEGVPESGNNKWIMGHLHTPHTIGNTIYAGTLYQTSFGEQEDKRFLHCKFDVAKEKLKVRSIPMEKPFTLRTLTVNTFKELKQNINKDPTIYWRILYKDFELPTNFLMEYPNVVECKSFKSKKQLIELLEYEDTPYSITDGVDDFLKGRGFSDKQVKRAHKLIKQAIKERGES